MKNIFTGLLLVSVVQTAIVADDIYEENDSFENAKLLTKGSYSLSGLDEDWFKVELHTGSTTFTMTPHTGADLNMILRNSDNLDIAADFATGKETITYNILYSGTYYIKIYPTTVETTDYTLSIDYEASTGWEQVLDFGPIRSASVALYDIDNDGKDEIFIGTSKTLDANQNETRPAGLICLEDDGTVKWTKTFPALYDNTLQKTYNTTSVTGTPFFSDIDGDASIDILIGVGADTFGEGGAGVVGQPGDKGGLYALDANGNIKWYFQTQDIAEGADGRPDGIYGSPIVYDIDKDGQRDVIVTSWDQHVSILDARTGVAKLRTTLADTIWSTPNISDINNDGIVEILVTGDITENADAQTQTGGVFHVLSADGTQNIAGFNQPFANPQYAMLRGKFEDQPLWSSPVVGDIDNDGFLEIVYGTGNYFTDGRGEYIRVWNHDGTEKFVLPTDGRTFATPLIADINNDGSLDIVASTLNGYIYAWDANGNQILGYKSEYGNPIFSSPIAVDIDGDGNLEIIYVDGAQINIINSQGQKLNDDLSMIVQLYNGTPVVKDIDGDGSVDVVSGGTTLAKDQAVVTKWTIPGSTSAGRIGREQLIGSTIQIRNFVKRFYTEILSREYDPAGINYWADELITGIGAGSDIANGFIFSDEFIGKNLDNTSYVETLYRAFFDRVADDSGLNSWVAQLNSGASRQEILNGFLYSAEFGNLCRSYGIIPVK